MPSARFQPSFSGGVLGPGLHGRIDIAKYDIGLKVGKNVFIQTHGGVSNRAGFEFVCEVMDHTKQHRLIPFERDADNNLILLMGDAQMKVIDMGAVVQSGGGDYVAATPYGTAEALVADYVQSIDVMYFAQAGDLPQKMSRISNTNWTFADIALDPSLTAPSISSVTSAMAGAETYTYKVSPVAGGVEGFPSAEASVATAQSLTVDGAENTITWTGTADEFNVYRERNGVFGYIGFTEDNSFTDDNIDPVLTDTPVEAAGIFSGAGEYPSVVTMSQQRLVFAGSGNAPETIWASRIGDFENFSRSRILRADDRLQLDLSGQSLNSIKSLLQLRELLAFTATGEFSITGPGGTLVADSPIQTQYGYSGSTGVKPLVVEDTALFVDRTGRNVRDLRYAFEQDGYSGNDLTIFASHFFEDATIAGWDFAKSPFSVVWVHLSDGKLLSFTYKREHQIWAWCEHDVGGEVESVATVREGADDFLYAIIKRTINGQTRRYVERMHDRRFTDATDCFFVDSGLTYEGAAVSIISGLDHLEGETVVALADGDVVEGLTVSGGSITLPRESQKVHVGLPYVAEIENLPPAIDIQGVGSARGRPQAVSGIYAQLEKTRGIEAAGSGREFNEIVQTGRDLADVIELFTGMVELQTFADWNRDGTVVIRQRYPLPMTILGLSPKMSIGRTG